VLTVRQVDMFSFGELSKCLPEHHFSCSGGGGWDREALRDNSLVPCPPPCSTPVQPRECVRVCQVLASAID